VTGARRRRFRSEVRASGSASVLLRDRRR
jgi:hypothetical protein